MYKRTLPTLVVALGMVAGLVTATPAAAVGRTLWVVPDPTTPATNNIATATSCANPTYAGASKLVDAVSNAQAGDEIVLCNAGPNTTGIFNLPATLNVTQPITISGAANSSSRRPVLSGQSTRRVININVTALGTVTLQGITVANGKVSSTADPGCASNDQCGAGIKLTNGAVIIDRSVVRDNSAASGAAIAVIGSGEELTIKNSALLDNVATIDAGALYNNGANSITVFNTTFARNYATAGTGAVMRTISGTANFNFVTTLENGAAGTVFSGTGIQLKNSVLAQRANTTPQCDTTVALSSGNLITTNGCAGATTYNVNNKNASSVLTYEQLRVGRLREGAGFVGVGFVPLLTGSAAIDYVAATEGDPTFDALGLPRLTQANPIADAGAFEVQSAANVRATTATLTFPSLVNFDQVKTVLPLASTQLVDGISASYSSLTPSVCTVADANIGTVSLLSAGTCSIESYVAAGSTNSIQYEEFLAVASFKAFVPGAPSIPTQILLTKTPTQFKIIFNAPVENGGSAIVSYRLIAQAKVGMLAKWKICTTSPCAVSGLLPDAEYKLSVEVRNADNFVGTHVLAKNIRTAVPLTPTEPQAVTVAPGTNQVIVKWLPPRTRGQSKLTNYIVRIYKTTNLKFAFKELIVNPAKLNATVKGLSRRTNYVARVFAFNVNGGSKPSKDVRLRTR
jgi:hypothetical protein